MFLVMNHDPYYKWMNSDLNGLQIYIGRYFEIYVDITSQRNQNANWIIEIILPIKSPCPKYELHERMKQNIICGRKYSIFDPVTYQNSKLLLIHPNSSIICKASIRMKIDFLEWYRKTCLSHKRSKMILCNREISDRWPIEDDYDWKFCYDENVIDQLSARGNIIMLNWWKNSGLKLKYSCLALDEASKNGRIEVLEWWRSLGLELRYTQSAMDLASKYGRVEALEWWRKSGLFLKYSSKAIFSASMEGHIEILEWWKNSGLNLIYDNEAIHFAFFYHRLDVINWWIYSGLELKYSPDTIRYCLKYDMFFSNWEGINKFKLEESSSI
jgi:hypothetical protein